MEHRSVPALPNLGDIDRRPSAGVTLNVKCYTCGMPTTKPRHAITETEQISTALAAAAKRWPDDADRPARLLRRLIEAGYESIAAEVAAALDRRREAIRGISGALTGAYEPGYLEDLREEWPE